MLQKSERKSIWKYRFFWLLFGVPAGAWDFLVLFMAIPSSFNVEPLTLAEAVAAIVTVSIIWFIVSFVIALIVHEVKRLKPKTKIVKEVQYIERSGVLGNSTPINKEPIIIFKNQEERNVLYSCKSRMDAEEYGKMVNCFSYLRRTYIKSRLLVVFYIMLGSLIASRNLGDTLIIGCVLLLVVSFSYKLNMESLAAEDFKRTEKKQELEKEYLFEFYDEYVLRHGANATVKMKYAHFDGYLETVNRLYLKCERKNIIFAIQKESCTDELLCFIKAQMKDIRTRKEKLKLKAHNHSPKVDIVMKILFVFTLLSLMGAIFSLLVLQEINPSYGLEGTKNMWVFWCWLPIPVVSIVLGYRYRRVGYKCTKNIVSGFIIGFVLLIYGSFWLMFSSPSEDYSEIYPYVYMIDARLPEEGLLWMEEWDVSIGTDQTNAIILDAYFEAVDMDDFVYDIEHSDHWIRSTMIEPILTAFIPKQIFYAQNTYISIYNKTLQEYNTFPSSSGEYELCVMEYNIADKHLKIYEYVYFYR